MRGGAAVDDICLIKQRRHREKRDTLAKHPAVPKNVPARPPSNSNPPSAST
jgi:hypothetical protein